MKQIIINKLNLLEEENKILEKECASLDNELNQKKAEMSAKNFLTEKEKADIEKKNAIFLEKFNKLNAVIKENYIFPEGENASPILRNTLSL